MVFIAWKGMKRKENLGVMLVGPSHSNSRGLLEWVVIFQLYGSGHSSPPKGLTQDSPLKNPKSILKGFGGWIKPKIGKKAVSQRYQLFLLLCMDSGLYGERLVVHAKCNSCLSNL
ncbi:unnamed protein product [Prunus brigantina]